MSLITIASPFFSPSLPHVQTAPIHDIDTSSAVRSPLGEMRLQFNLQQEQREGFPVGLDCASAPPLRRGWGGTLTRQPSLRAAISPVFLPLFVSLGFQLATMRGLPLSLGAGWCSYFRPAEGQLRSERSRAASLFPRAGAGRVIRLHFWDCHKGSAWQTVAHHFLAGEKKERCQMKCTKLSARLER